MIFLKYLFYFGFISLILLSCAVTSEVGIPFNIKEAIIIKSNETTMDNIIEIFGEPYKRLIETGTNNETFLYYYTENGQQYDLMVIKFNENDIIINYRAESGNVGSSEALIHTYIPIIK